MQNELIRPRRLRKNENIRQLARETRISKNSLIWPVFVVEGENIYSEIKSLPNQFHYSLDNLYKMIERAQKHGISKIILFGIIKKKDFEGSGSWNENGIIQQAIKKIKQLCPEMYVITDVCMCEYTSHGHCGILCDNEVDNDKTIEKLAQIALSHAKAGADMVAPSDMMDGRIKKIRNCLDNNGFYDIPIMSYSAKFSSGFYGPFRDASDCAPSFGDRRSYQMDFHNSREAVREILLDVSEGADIIMIKPAMTYLDIVQKARQKTDLPIACYSVSGEYAMIKAASKAGLIDEYKIMCESAVCMYRAGADIIITYYACELADAIENGDIG